MKKISHGGNIYKKAKEMGIREEDILDFSANISPLGLPEHIRQAMVKAIDQTINYPDPDCSRLKEAISNAAKNWILKCILGTPTVEYASYYKSTSRYFNYSYVAVKWSEVENATSYKVRVTKTDGSYKEYDTTYAAFYSTNYTDDFIADGMDGAIVSVKAYGYNDTFGCWSEEYTITNNGSFY